MLHDFVTKYYSYISDHKQDVELGKTMLESGSKTEVIQQFETLLSNPIKGLLTIREQADDSLFKSVHGLMSMYFSKAKEKSLIKTAYKKNDINSLMYLIVLNKDDFDSRDEVFDFLNFYSTLDFSEKVPVYFQFVPENLSNKFSNEEVVA